MINLWRHNWYYVGGIIFVALTFIMGLWGCTHLSTIQVILIFSWMAMLVHQFEEYAVPGGFPAIANYVGMGEKDIPDRYPLNANQCFISNVFLCYATYIVPIFFPNLIWLGAGQVMMGLWQLPAHGIMMNRRLGSIYNPGLGATVFLQLPVAIYYIWYVAVNMPALAMQMWWGIPLSLLGLAIVFFIPILVMHNRNNNYPFNSKEMYGYAKEKIKAMQRGEIESPKPLFK